VEVVSYGSAIRQRIEALILGTAGTTHVMEAGRFHLEAPDAPGFDAHPLHSAERAVRVGVRPGTNIRLCNPFDGFVLRRHRVLVRVSYALTHAGGDLAETVTEQSGPATLEAVEDRATTDAHDIERVLVWPENRAGVSPTVYAIQPIQIEPTFDVQEDRVVMELPFWVDVQAALSTFAP
jgi:hypothetical protein